MTKREISIARWFFTLGIIFGVVLAFLTELLIWGLVNV